MAETVGPDISVNFGDVLWPDPDSDEQDRHLRIVASHESEDGEVVIVSFTTLREGSETTVKVKPGEHPELKVESVVGYFYARLISVEEIKHLLRSGEFWKPAPLTEDLRRKVVAGFSRTKSCPMRVKQELRRQKLIP